jgi:DNA-directed RNA polymerase subunit RPC12/RpoP
MIRCQPPDLCMAMQVFLNAAGRGKKPLLTRASDSDDIVLPVTKESSIAFSYCPFCGVKIIGKTRVHRKITEEIPKTRI